MMVINSLIVPVSNKLIDKKISIITFILFIFLWEIAIHIFNIPTYILPSPINIAKEFYANIYLITWFTVVTAYESLLGFLLAILLAIPIAILIAFHKFFKVTLYPLVVATQLIPKIALAPLFITWFGFGYLPKIIIVFMLCFFPILLNTILGFLSLPIRLEWLTKSTGAGSIKQLFKMRLPYALPQIFVGIKWASVNATVGATIGEWIGGDAGLGYYIQIASGNLQMNLAFAIIVILAALGMLLYGSVILLETRFIFWHESQRNKINPI